MGAAIIELDLHGMNCHQAKSAIDSVLSKIDNGTYRVRLIHGYHGGTSLSRMIYEEYGYGREERVKRIVNGSNQGITELIIREY